MKHFIQMLCTAGAALFAAVLLVACSGAFDTPAQQASSDTGTVVIRAGNGAARTILPTGPDTFSRYELTLTKPGSEPVTPDATGIDGAGVEVRLEPGEWTATVNAYRQFTVSGGTLSEYLAAKGGASLTVTAGGTNTETVTVKPVAFAEANGVKGIFSWDITLPGGLSGAKLRLGEANTVNLLETASGSVEIDAGAYHLFITLEKDGLNAGLYEWVYIYPGLESQAAFNFGAGGEDELAFTDRVLLAGTVLVTNESGAVVGSLTVSAYSDDAYQNEISSAVVTDDVWLLSIPAGYIGKPVYLKLSAANYASLEDTHTVEALPKNGQVGIALELELEFVTGDAAITAIPPAIPGDAVIDLTGPEPSVLWRNGTITASVDNYEEFTGSYSEVFTGSYSGAAWTLLGNGWRQSPYIGDSQTSKTRYSFTSTGIIASLLIRLDVSSEGNFDFAFVGYLDSTASMSSYYDRISDSTSTTIAISIPTAGSHFVEIGYGKDGSVSRGSDCAWFTLEQYETSAGGISWYIDGVQIAGQTSGILAAQNASDYSLGTHRLTVIATKSDGKSYSKTVNFTIVKE
jgi:hypothetical protein